MTGNANGVGTTAAAPPARCDYEAHFHESASGYLVLSTDGTVLDVNRKLVSWTGHSPDELIGGKALDLLPAGERADFASHVTEQLVESGCFNEIAVDLLTAEGQRIPVLLSGVRSEGDGAAPTLDRISVFNASERRRYEQELIAALHKAETAEAARAAAEAELRENQKVLEEKDRVLRNNLRESRKREALLDNVLNTADVALLVLDAEGGTVLTNAHLDSTWRRVMGEANAAEGEPVVFGPDRVTPVPKEERPVARAAAGEAYSNQVVWFGPADDRQLALNVCARPIMSDGVFSGSVIAISDVTRLVQAVAAQEEFVASVSHELRTPLTSILGYLDMAMEDEGLSDQVRTALDVALRNAERLLDLVSDLLSVASGATKMERRAADVADVVRAGLLSVAPRAAANRVDLVQDLPASLTAEVDPQRLAQVVDNLLSNSVKYSPDGGTVTVRLWQEGQVVRLQVADTGIGMSAAEQAQVFTKFFRSNRAVASAVPGVGLGLVIARNIVEAHGGTLTFTSAAGQGTVFTAAFPVSAEAPEQ